MSLICPSCGQRTVSDATYCSSCGTRIADDGERTQATTRLLEPSGAGPETPHRETGTTVTGATLMVRSGPQAGERFRLAGSRTRLGRHPECDVSLDDISVSRRHAEIERRSDEFVLRDVGSLNGTYVNQRRVDSVVLQQGDEILIGRFRLLFLAPPEPA